MSHRTGVRPAVAALSKGDVPKKHGSIPTADSWITHEVPAASAVSSRSALWGRTHSSVPRRRRRATRRCEPGSYFFFSNPQITHETHAPCPSLSLRAKKASESGRLRGNRSRGVEVSMKVFPIFAVSRVLLAAAAMLALSAPSQSQQEVDPTWHNPWPEPNKTVAHKPQPGPPAKHAKEKKITATTDSRKKNSGPNDVHGQQRPRQVATTKSPTPR
jgi:hypothetical protein